MCSLSHHKMPYERSWTNKTETVVVFWSYWWHKSLDGRTEVNPIGQDIFLVDKRLPVWSKLTALPFRQLKSEWVENSHGRQLKSWHWVMIAGLDCLVLYFVSLYYTDLLAFRKHILIFQSYNSFCNTWLVNISSKSLPKSNQCESKKVTTLHESGRVFAYQ